MPLSYRRLRAPHVLQIVGKVLAERGTSTYEEAKQVEEVYRPCFESTDREQSLRALESPSIGACKRPDDVQGPARDQWRHTDAEHAHHGAFPINDGDARLEAAAHRPDSWHHQLLPFFLLPKSNTFLFQIFTGRRLSRNRMMRCKRKHALASYHTTKSPLPRLLGIRRYIRLLLACHSRSTSMVTMVVDPVGSVWLWAQQRPASSKETR